MLPSASIFRTGQPLATEVLDHRLGLGGELAQPVADDLLGVVAALVEHAAAAVADPRHARRLGHDVVAGLAALAGAAAGDALDQLLLGSVEHDHPVHRLAVAGQHPTEDLCLGDGAREAVEQEAARGVRLLQALAEQLEDELVRDQLALVDEALAPAGRGACTTGWRRAACRRWRRAGSRRPSRAVAPASLCQRPEVQTAEGSHSTPDFFTEKNRLTAADGSGAPRVRDPGSAVRGAR